LCLHTNNGNVSDHGGPEWKSLSSCVAHATSHSHASVSWPWKKTWIDQRVYIANHESHIIRCLFTNRNGRDLIDKLNAEYWDNIKETA
jgi:hypothetical protein